MIAQVYHTREAGVSAGRDRPPKGARSRSADRWYSLLRRHPPALDEEEIMQEKPSPTAIALLLFTLAFPTFATGLAPAERTAPVGGRPIESALGGS